MPANVISIASSPSRVDADVLTISPAKVLQATQERRESRLADLMALWKRHEHTEPPHALALLRPRHNRPRRRAAEQADELAPPHGLPIRSRAKILSHHRGE